MSTLSAFDAAATAKLLDFAALIDALRTASLEHDAGKIHAPVRVGVPLPDGGVMLSMPASASDIAIHKLVSVAPANARRNMPTIFGMVTVCDGSTGKPEFILDGPTVTGRRTAALSMLGAKLLSVSPPRAMLIVGAGQQARFHALAIAALYPSAKLFVKGRSAASESSFVETMAREGVAVSPALGTVPPEADVVITVTTSKTPVYAEGAREGRLVIGVGAFTPDAAEIGPDTVRGSLVFVDDLKATQAEAGDLLQADIDWSAVRPLSSAIALGVPYDRPVMLKMVGSGAWDLAACRVARAALG
jgi:ornithine cyclodeaminase/1-piperideine-2-carboxylate/1-pyrroline-2-carboxylate reductase [NAD(P)H]